MKAILLLILLNTFFGLPPNCQSTLSPETLPPVSHEHIHQFLNTRCQKIATWTEDLGNAKFKRFPQISTIYEPLEQYPFTIYYSQSNQLKPLFLMAKGICRGLHITVPLPYPGIYYAIIHDNQNPSMLLINAQTNKLEVTFYQSCVLHN